ncbi:LysR family transcriptional regulator [Mesorhizobium australafricanum]|uniref:LysR family transcriptional regulator n=1 Tax=Mesorhizobium australafricanum TaxID=3072311 RepID=A0ABU4WSB9_9HYPH|nr:LysR family transcriptional regulator [Mesorhizobium sp. VK3E]MDX8438962.1 LysR family transcriptional regulator [Mesorhizobium sp. VK3E]
MSNIDHLDLDGRALQLFLAVLEKGSVTEAANVLDVTQSAVSHQLEKLRRIVRDPLFVKSGRGIVATAHARALGEQARELLDAMRDFARGAEFDPATARLSLRIAANDLQRELLLPRLFERLEDELAGVDLRVLPSDVPTTEMLRDDHCDLLISPFPPEGIDILQKRLLTDRYICFFDPRMREAPCSWQDYIGARHVTVVYPDKEQLRFDKELEAAGIRRDIAIAVPGFSGVPAFLLGTDRLASLPSLLSRSLMREFASAPVPLLDAADQGEQELVMFMAWHRRYQNDPGHGWLRAQAEQTAMEIAGS